MKQIEMYVNGHTLDNKNPGAAGSGVVLSEALTKPCAVTVYSCNQWLVRCAEGAWQRGKHQDLWQVLDGLCQTHTVTFEWIKKGSHELLDRASMLANEGANESAVDLAS